MKQILDTASLQDIISTLQYDIHTLQNKIQVEKTQGTKFNRSISHSKLFNSPTYIAEMKEKLDVYTEEGNILKLPGLHGAS